MVVAHVLQEADVHFVRVWSCCRITEVVADADPENQHRKSKCQEIQWVLPPRQNCDFFVGRRYLNAHGSSVAYKCVFGVTLHKLFCV